MFRFSFYPIVERVFGEYRARKTYEKLAKSARVRLGKANAEIFLKRAGRTRPLVRLALDTQIHQIASIERPAWYPSGEVDPKIEGFPPPGHYGPMKPDFGVLEPEIKYLYSIFELGRQSCLQFVKTNTVEIERQHAKDKHTNSFGCTPLDHDIKYHDSNFGCARLEMSVSSSTMPWGSVVDRNSDECRIELDRHKLIFRHLSGQRHRKDAWHFMICDALGVEFFLTADTKFLKAYEQIQEKLAKNGVRTVAIAPSAFCKRFGIWPISPPITDPKAALWGAIR